MWRGRKTQKARRFPLRTTARVLPGSAYFSTGETSDIWGRAPPCGECPMNYRVCGILAPLPNATAPFCHQKHQACQCTTLTVSYLAPFGRARHQLSCYALILSQKRRGPSKHKRSLRIFSPNKLCYNFMDIKEMIIPSLCV